MKNRKKKIAIRTIPTIRLNTSFHPLSLISIDDYTKKGKNKALAPTTG
jgi:hypothetical protein